MRTLIPESPEVSALARRIPAGSVEAPNSASAEQALQNRRNRSASDGAGKSRLKPQAARRPWHGLRFSANHFRRNPVHTASIRPLPAAMILLQILHLRSGKEIAHASGESHGRPWKSRHRLDYDEQFFHLKSRKTVQTAGTTALHDIF